MMWLGAAPYAGSWPFCLTFVRGGGESEVLAAFGAGLRDEPARITARSAPASAGPAGLPLVLLRRSGDWLVALEQNIPPQGARPEVLRNVSAATEAVMLYQDVGKLDHEFAHAADGEVVSAVTTLWPPHWWGSDPDRLRPLAQELGLGPAGDADEDSDLTGLEVLLALAEGAFGLSLEEAGLDQPWLAAPVLPVLADLPPGPQPDQPPRTGDPVIDLYLAHITGEDLRSVLARRVSRLIAAASLEEYRELADRVQGALAGRAQQATGDDPVQVTLRQLAWARRPPSCTRPRRDRLPRPPRVNPSGESAGGRPRGCSASSWRAGTGKRSPGKSSCNAAGRNLGGASRPSLISPMSRSLQRNCAPPKKPGRLSRPRLA